MQKAREFKVQGDPASCFFFFFSLCFCLYNSEIVYFQSKLCLNQSFLKGTEWGNPDQLEILIFCEFQYFFNITVENVSY